MIIYDFRCEFDHRFEGWFKSSDDCDVQLADGQLRCPICESAAVLRVPSAVHVKTAAGREASTARPDRLPAGNGRAVARPGVDQARVAALMDRLRRVVASAEDVGEAFADEARRIHRDESPERAIRGVATREEVTALDEEGIPVLSVPPHLLDKPH